VDCAVVVAERAQGLDVGGVHRAGRARQLLGVAQQPVQARVAGDCLGPALGQFPREGGRVAPREALVLVDLDTEIVGVRLHSVEAVVRARDRDRDGLALDAWQR